MKIGILGGSFDPVHLGHVHLAMDAKKKVGLDRVVFIPAGRQPFKLDREMSSGEDRTVMLRLATEGLAGMEISDCELEEPGVSYTYLTIRAMRRRFGEEAKLYFITGTDSFLKIETWKNSEELLKSCSYIIGTRPGYRQKELEACMGRLRGVYGTEAVNIDNDQFDISSTEVRRRIREGLSCEGLLPEKVERYILDNGLYR